VELAAGQNVALPADDLRVVVSGPVDLTALVCNDDGKVSGDSDMVFFNNPSGPGLSVSGSDLTARLSALRPGATKVALVASPSDQTSTFGALPAVALTATCGDLSATFAPTGLGSETALVLCEAYLRGGVWKLRAVGQGYASGLAGVAKDFGISVDDEPAAAAAPAAAPISLSKVPIGKIRLEKSGSAKISLNKEDVGNLVLTAHLNWKGRGGGLPADLDLYALIIDQQGNDGVVYYRNLGSLSGAPWVQLDGDSVVPGRETVKVIAGRNRYVLIAAYSAVENGVGSFFSYQAEVVIDDGAGSEVTIPLFFDDEHSYWVAITLMDFTDPTGVKISQLEQYGKPNSENRPLLKADGSVIPSAGPVEFKTDQGGAPGQPAAPKKKGLFGK
jgi:stress response protein SCP2